MSWHDLFNVNLERFRVATKKRKQPKRKRPLTAHGNGKLISVRTVFTKQFDQVEAVFVFEEWSPDIQDIVGDVSIFIAAI